MPETWSESSGRISERRGRPLERHAAIAGKPQPFLRCDSARGRLVTDYIERLNAGDRIEPAEILLRHPRHGEEILAQLELFVGAGSSGDDLESEPLGTLGDYTLRRQIGRGGMGVVYEAWENSMDRAVALKVLPAGIAADDLAFQRFLQEAKTAGKLSHLTWSRSISQA